MKKQSNTKIQQFKKHWKLVLLIAFGAYLVAALIVGNQNYGPEKIKSNKVVLSEKSANFLHELIKNDIESLIAGKKSIFSFEELGVTPVYAAQLSKEYEANEVAADFKYKGKQLKVTGVVESISKDFMDNPILHLRGAGLFSNAMAYMEENELSTMVAMAKGDAVQLICHGDGVIMASPVLKSCRSSLAGLTDLAVHQVNQFLAGNSPQAQKLSYVVIMALYMDSHFDDKSVCWSSLQDKKCSAELDAALKSPAAQEEFKKIHDQFVDQGLIQLKTK